ncbi:hypothetical protein O9993_13075 [Vibrio lentus]|nr:hypothetical protein [Vibrio lentus]
MSLIGSQYGFFFPYSQDLGGVAIEPWHISRRKFHSCVLSTVISHFSGKQLQSKPILGYEIIMGSMEQDLCALRGENISH